MTIPNPGWYPPDPRDPSVVRYWDGQRWTSQHLRWDGRAWVDPGVTGPGAGGERPKGTPGGAAPVAGTPTRHRGLVVGAVAGVLVAATVAVGVVVSLRDDGEPGLVSPGSADGITTAHVARTDERAGYDYTDRAPELEDRTLEFSFRTSFDPWEAPDWAVEESETPSHNHWAFRVFADPGLTIEAPTLVTPSSRGGRGFAISSYETRHAEPFSELGTREEVIRSSETLDDEGQAVDERGDWGLYGSYYLVRYIDADGAKLERPVVSEFSFAQELDTPRPVVGVDPSAPGALRFEWAPVDGAASYRIVKSFIDARSSEQATSRDYVVVARTKENTWSSASQEMDRYGFELDTGRGWQREQNSALEMFTTSEDDSVRDGLDRAANHDQVEYGVIAVALDGTTSAFGRGSVAEDVRSLPHKLAEASLLSLDQCGSGTPWGTRCTSVDEALTHVPYVALDGSVRVTPAVMLEDPINSGDSRYTAAVLGEGTELGYWLSFEAGSDEEFRAAVAAFNERSRAAAPATGVVQVRVTDLTAPADPVSEHSAEAAALAHGSNELVSFIAAHMVDGTEAIDVSGWSDWGWESISDAMAEAYWQNPLAAVTAYDYSPTHETIVVEYEDDRERRVADTTDEIDRVIAEIISPGMSERDRVAAINQHLVDTVEYDREALEASFGIVMPPAYTHAWTLSGAVLDGSAVCVGYAQAFKALADAADLDAMVVTGTVLSSASGHAWNKVRVDGEWYAVDPTWNDGGDPTEFLMITDSQFVDRAARTYESDWVYDLYQEDYATP